jgi:FixJ family two-component response regulator
VEDEESIRKALTRLLRSAGLDVETFSSALTFVESLNKHLPDCLLLDLHMPGMDGFEVLGRLENAGVRLPVIIITGHDSPEVRERVMAAKPAAYLRKPVDEQILLDAIELASQPAKS